MSHLTRILCFMAAAGVAAGAQERCYYEGEFHDFAVSHPLCFYYTGTEHFRNQEYGLAARQWKKLLSLKDVEQEFPRLVAGANNNLGYFHYYGLGVEQNTEAALAYWWKAVSWGSEESDFHLCYALGDPASAAYAPENAILHCAKAEKIYLGKEHSDPSDAEILDTIRRYKEMAERENGS